MATVKVGRQIECNERARRDRGRRHGLEVDRLVAQVTAIAAELRASDPNACRCVAAEALHSSRADPLTGMCGPAIVPDICRIVWNCRETAHRRFQAMPGRNRHRLLKVSLEHFSGDAQVLLGASNTCPSADVPVHRIRLHVMGLSAQFMRKVPHFDMRGPYRRRPTRRRVHERPAERLQ